MFIDKAQLRCPRCGAKTRPTLAVDAGYSRFIVKCIQCPTYINLFIPLPHQYAFSKDPARYTMAAGGVGTGKTEGDVMDHIKHAIITPNGASLLGAPTLPQLRATLKKQLEMTLPMDFLSRVSKVESTLTYANGHEVLYRPFDDPEKLKSLNLSSFIILEASRTKYSVFTELQRRLRNTAAVRFAFDDEGVPVYEEDAEGNIIHKVAHDWRKGNLETNPDAGWVKSDILERSGTVTLHHKDLHDEKFYFKNINPQISTHITPTKANFYLPRDFVKDQSSGMPQWYIRRNFFGSFTYAEGMIYPNFLHTLVEPFKIPRNWKRVIAVDYGIADKTHFLFGAIDNDKKICYLYDEIVINNADVKEIVSVYKPKVLAIPAGLLIGVPKMDQRSLTKRQSHDVQKTLGDLFEDEGVYFEPAQMNLDARILRTNTLINLGQLKIFSNLTHLIDEGRNYKFPERDVDKPSANANKPVDKHNHGMNAMEFLAMELPHNLEQVDFRVYNNTGKAVDFEEDLDYTPRPFSPFNEVKKDDSYNDYGNDLYDPFSDF